MCLGSVAFSVCVRLYFTFFYFFLLCFEVLHPARLEVSSLLPVHIRSLLEVGRSACVKVVNARLAVACVLQELSWRRSRVVGPVLQLQRRWLLVVVAVLSLTRWQLCVVVVVGSVSLLAVSGNNLGVFFQPGWTLTCKLFKMSCYPSSIPRPLNSHCERSGTNL